MFAIIPFADPRFLSGSRHAATRVLRLQACARLPSRIMAEPHEEHRSWQDQEAAADEASANLRRQIDELKVKVWTYSPETAATNDA